MKTFTSVRNFVVESISSGREKIYVVENDIDRTTSGEKEGEWEDLFPEVEIDGEIFKTRWITGESTKFSVPQSFEKGSLIGISVM